MINQALKNDLEYTFKKLDKKEVQQLDGATILITGCAGFIGFYFTHFLYYLRERFHIKKVILLDNFISGYPAWLGIVAKDPCFDVARFNIINDNIEKVVGADSANYVIHMASIASPLFYRQHPIETMDANVWGLRRLLDFYYNRPLRGFLFFSSSEIYGDPIPEAIPTNEEYYGNVCAVGPRACYDESKRFGETMCMLFAKKYQMPIGVVRPFNNYGPGMKLNDRRVPADFAEAVRAGRDMVILSDGNPKRTFCYIADAVVGYFKALLAGNYDYYNIGIESPEITIRELAQIYQEEGKEVLGYEGNVVYDSSSDTDYLTNNPQRRCPNIQKARRNLGYNPEISVREGVRRFLEFIRQSDEENLLW